MEENALIMILLELTFCHIYYVFQHIPLHSLNHLLIRMVAPPRFELGKGTDFESAGCAILLNPRGHNSLLECLYRTYEVRTVVLGGPDRT